jgi:hypothetical protein
MSAPQLTQYIQGQGSVSADGLNTFMQTCDTVAQLRAFVGLPGIEVTIRGFTAPGDGGAGQFYWDQTGTGPDNGTTIIVPTAAASGCWVRLVNFSGGANPLFQAASVGSQSLTSTSWTKVTNLTPIIDNTGGWNVGDNWYVVPQTGYYQLSGSVDVTYTAGGVEDNVAAITKGGIPGIGTILAIVTLATPIGTALEQGFVLPTVLIQLTAGDEVQLNINVIGSSLAVNPSSDNRTGMCIQYIAAV